MAALGKPYSMSRYFLTFFRPLTYLNPHIVTILQIMEEQLRIKLTSQIILISFFTNIGHQLAADINPPTESCSIHDYLENINKNSMLLNPVREDEIISIAEAYNNKHSTDSIDLNINVIKKS